LVPPRREVRVIVEERDPKSDLTALSELVRAYSERLGIRALGVLVCDTVPNESIERLKEHEGVDVRYIRKSAIAG